MVQSTCELVAREDDEHLQLRLIRDAQEGAGSLAVELLVGDDAAPTSDRFALDGVSTQGGLVRGTTLPGVKVYFRGRRVRVSEGGDFLVGFGLNARAAARLTLLFPDGTRAIHMFAVTPREFADQVRDGVDDALVHPTKAARRALRRSQKKIRKVRRRDRPGPKFLTGFQWPVRGRLGAGYGGVRVLNGVRKGPHWGIDIAAPAGRKVRAPADGLVVLAVKNVPLSGHTIILDHGHGLTSSFLHLRKITVERG